MMVLGTGCNQTEVVNRAEGDKRWWLAAEILESTLHLPERLGETG